MLLVCALYFILYVFICICVLSCVVVLLQYMFHYFVFLFIHPLNLRIHQTALHYFVLLFFHPLNLCIHQTANFTIIAYCLWTLLLHCLCYVPLSSLYLPPFFNPAPFLQVLTAAQQGQTLLTTEDMIFTSVDFDLNMQGLTCNQVQYVCIEFAKGPNPTTIFNLIPVPDSSVLVSCSPASCEGLLKLSVNS